MNGNSAAETAMGIYLLILGLLPLLALLLFLVPRTPKHTLWAMLFVLALSLPLLAVARAGH